MIRRCSQCGSRFETFSYLDTDFTCKKCISPSDQKKIQAVIEQMRKQSLNPSEKCPL